MYCNAILYYFNIYMFAHSTLFNIYKPSMLLLLNIYSTDKHTILLLKYVVVA